MKKLQHNFGENVIVYEGSKIGKNVNISDFTIIFPGVIIRDNVTIGIHCIIGKPPSKGKNQLDLPETNIQTVIGKNTLICDQVVIYQGCQIGKNNYIADKSLIRENVCLKDDIVIGTGVIVSFNSFIDEGTKIMSGTNIGGNMKIGKNCFIGVQVVSFNDRNPEKVRSRDEHISAEIKDGVILGSNCTVYPGIAIASNSKVGAGSVVTRSLEKVNSTYVGVPAKILIKK